jgi:hypothetical protein
MTPEVPYCVGLRVTLRQAGSDPAVNAAMRSYMASAGCLPA